MIDILISHNTKSVVTLGQRGDILANRLVFSLLHRPDYTNRTEECSALISYAHHSDPNNVMQFPAEIENDCIVFPLPAEIMAASGSGRLDVELTCGTINETVYHLHTRVLESICEC